MHRLTSKIGWLKQKQLNPEKGASMLEAAIIIPFLLFTGLACWDTAKLLNVHAKMLATADEAAQFAASDPELEFGEYETSWIAPVTPPLASPIPPDICLSALGYECRSCTGPVCTSSCGGAEAARSNLCVAVTSAESTGMTELREGSIVARLNFNTPIAKPDTVEVVLSGTFDGLFLFTGQPVQVRKMLPYLGPR